VLEEANVKLGSVVSDVFGVSGQFMLEKLLDGEGDIQAIAQLAQKAAPAAKSPISRDRWKDTGCAITTGGCCV
jgi:hypothetical protein